METTTKVIINTILVLTDTFILRCLLNNVDLILSSIDEPIIHIVDSGKEFSVVIKEVGQITRKGTFGENFTKSIVCSWTTDIIFLRANLNQTVKDIHIFTIEIWFEEHDFLDINIIELHTIVAIQVSQT